MGRKDIKTKSRFMASSCSFFCHIVTLGYKFSKERGMKKWGQAPFCKKEDILIKEMEPGPIY
jgi:hypothetical protein